MQKQTLLCVAGAAMCAVPSLVQAQQQQKKPNVLFIALDDLRPELNCYGYAQMKTPNFDRLAARGTIFQRAYCQQAVSACSRNSLLTGLRPDAIGIYNLATYFRTTVPDVVTLPQHFKQNGYQVEAVGKIYHTGHGNKDDAASWSVPKWDPNRVLGTLERVNRGDTTNIQGQPNIAGKNLPYYVSQTPEADHPDARSVTVAIDRIKTNKDKPFFMAVGFVKPHLPFVAPKKYWDMYDPSQIVIPERGKPDGMPALSLMTFGELRKYHGIPAKGPLDDKTSRDLIHGYYACVSFVDAQLGRLLDALDEAGVADNTIIVLWGDHGWKLGEFGSWCKHSNNELDTNVPLMFAAPGFTQGQASGSIVEFVDIYPTLCDLAGLPKPTHLQGTSLVPVMNNPSVSVKEVAISQYPRGKGSEIMGYAMRTDQYRYTRWINIATGEVVATELYDQSKGRVPDRNLAGDPQYKKTVGQLDAQLTAELAKYKTLNKK